jgi:CBS domain-containing protein
MRVRDIMTTPVHTVRQDAAVADAAGLLAARGITALPVLDAAGALVGIVSRRDILRAVVRGDDVLTWEVQHRLDEYAGAAGRWTATVTGGVVTVAGDCADRIERGIVAVLARTVPGVAAVHFADTAPR